MSASSKRNKVIAAVVLIVIIAVGVGFYATQLSTGTTTTTASGLPVPNRDTLIEETAREPGPGGLDPALTWDAGGNIIFENVYETLVTFDGPRADKFIPWLAESWDVSPDGLAYTFHLRKGITFQDGTPFNASAVKFSFDRAVLINHPDGPQFLIAPSETLAIKGAPRYFNAETVHIYNASEVKTYLAQEGVKVIDDYTVQFTLEHPYAAAIATFAFASSASIVSPSYVIKNCPGSTDMPGVTPGIECEFMRTHAAGTGPYKLVEVTPKSRVVLERYDGYWGGPQNTGPAKIQRYIIKYVPETGTRELDLYAGTADAIELPATNAFDVIDKDAWLNNHEIKPLKTGIRVWTAKTLQIQDFYVNPRTPPFDNINFRLAMALAFPYDKYITQVLNGFGTLRAGEIPEGMLGYDPTLPAFRYDPDRARQLFQQVGYKGTIEFTVSTGDTNSLTAVQLLQDSMKQLAPDVTVSIKEVDTPTWLTLYHQFAVQVRIGGWLQDIADPAVMIANFATPGGFRALFTGFDKNQTIIQLVNQAGSSLDPDKRAALYREIQLEMIRKVAYIPVTSPMSVQVERDWVLPSDSPIGRALFNPESGDGDGGVQGGYHPYSLIKAQTTPQISIYIGNTPINMLVQSPYIAIVVQTIVPRNVF